MKWLIACAAVCVVFGCSDPEVVRQNSLLKDLVEDQFEIIESQNKLISLQKETIRALERKEKSE